MNILAIDTSTNVLGVGVVSQDKVIGEYMTNVKRESFDQEYYLRSIIC